MATSTPRSPNRRSSKATGRARTPVRPPAQHVEPRGGSVGRAVFSGSISFGLLQIPVSLYTAEKRSEEVHFRMLDKRDLSPIRFERVNAQTGEKVEWGDIVKGYELEPDRFVVVEPEELARASAQPTQTIDIHDFVPRAEIAPGYFETPYFIVPQKRSTRAYVLLREALVAKEAAAIATFVLRTRMQLAAILPVGDALMLNVLRFGHELKEDSELPLPEANAALPLPKRELDMAVRLVDEMMVDWTPAKYADSYHADVMRIIAEKAATGHVQGPSPRADTGSSAEVVDLFAVLEQSLRERGKRPAHNDHTREGSTARPGPKKAARGAKAKGRKTAAA